MSRADRSPEVDEGSVADFDPDQDEILVEPPDRFGRLSRRVRIALAVVLAAAVVAVLIVRAVTAGPSTPTATTGTPQPSSSPPLVPPPLHPAKTVVASGAAAACPQADDGLSLCSTSALVPAAALTAVIAHFPGATIRSKVEEDLRDVGYGSRGLWYREIRARRGPVTIVVEVHKRIGTDRSRGYSSETGGRAVLLDQIVTRSLTIQVRVTAATGRLPQVRTVQELARDSGLRAPAV